MAKPIFTWYPDEGASENIKPDVDPAKFGDGYEVRAAKGMNPEVISWDLSFTGNPATVSPIRTFLRDRGAMQSFQWSNPFNELGIYVCREWNSTKLSAGVVQLKAKFERVYEANI